MAVHPDTRQQPSGPADETTSDSNGTSAERAGPGSQSPEAQQEGMPAASEASVDEADGAIASPTELGARRFVYAGYFAGAIGVAFIVSKAIDILWLKIETYLPAIGEPRDELVMPFAGLIGVLTAVYYWRRTRARELVEQVAAEMSKVTWPSRSEVANGTVVVIVTTIVSTVFFALMDKFWGFITNLVYGGT